MKIKHVGLPAYFLSRNSIVEEIKKAKKEKYDVVHFYYSTPVLPYLTVELDNFTTEGRELLHYKQIE